MIVFLTKFSRDRISFDLRSGGFKLNMRVHLGFEVDRVHLGPQVKWHRRELLFFFILFFSFSWSSCFDTNVFLQSVNLQKKKKGEGAELKFEYQ